MKTLLIDYLKIVVVTGPPYVRAVGAIKAIAGEDLTINCPFSGYPIESIRWERGGQEIVSSKSILITNNC